MKISKNKNRIFLFLFGTLLALYLRFLLRNFVSGDYRDYLSRWINFFRDNSGAHAIKNLQSDYNVIYQYFLIIVSYLNLNDLYLVKIFSIIFDFLLAFGGMMLIGELGLDKQKQLICFFYILLSPIVIINSSMWGQCDSIYAAFIVWSLYFLLKERPCLSIICITLAFTFKLQTIFAAPIFLVALLYKKIKIRHIFIFLFTYSVTTIPALILGKPLKDILMVYLIQTQGSSLMTMNSTSIFSLFNIVEYNAFLEKLSIILMITLILTIIVLICRKKVSFTPKFAFSSAFVFCLLVPFMLPHMHDRYFYVAEILSIIYFMIHGIKRIYMPILLQIAGLIVYAEYFGFSAGFSITAQHGAVIVLSALILLLINYFRDYFMQTEYS